jgi:hypothetical protein
MHYPAATSRIFITLLPFLLVFPSRLSLGQCEDKQGFLKQLCLAKNMVHPSSPDASKPQPAPVASVQPLTTALSDAIHPDTLPPSVSPKVFKSLLKLDRADDGAFVLKRGFYQATVESFYFENSNDGSAKVGAFFPAPLLGARAGVLGAVLKQSELHPELRQQDIEQLLLAIYAGTDLEKMPQPVQQTALILLPRDVARQLKATVQAQSVEQNVMDVLNTRVRGAVGIKPAPQPAHVAPVSPSPATSDDGDSDGGDTSDLPAVRGTWAQMPGGFYVRYLPEGWSRTRIEIMVPDAALAKADPKHPLTFDPTQYLAILSQAPAQRLGITLRPVATAKR